MHENVNDVHIVKTQGVKLRPRDSNEAPTPLFYPYGGWQKDCPLVETENECKSIK
jgi:hypothetical protein